jgi:hypothetical protein
LVEVDGFGKIAVEPFVSLSAMFATNETLAGPKSSRKKT